MSSIKKAIITTVQWVYHVDVFSDNIKQQQSFLQSIVRPAIEQVKTFIHVYRKTEFCHHYFSSFRTISSCSEISTRSVSLAIRLTVSPLAASMSSMLAIPFSVKSGHHPKSWASLDMDGTLNKISCCSYSDWGRPHEHRFCENKKGLKFSRIFFPYIWPQISE